MSALSIRDAKLMRYEIALSRENARKKHYLACWRLSSSRSASILSLSRRWRSLSSRMSSAFSRSSLSRSIRKRSLSFSNRIAWLLQMQMKIYSQIVKLTKN